MVDDIRRRKLLVGAAVVGATTFTGCLHSSGGSGGDDGEGRPGGVDALPENGEEEYIGDVEQFESQGRNHVSYEVAYEQTPPLSGPHSEDWVNPGYYEEQQPAERLVHSLEHGAVVVYYDPEAITEEGRSDLQKRASTYTGTWTSFIAVPTPEESPEAPYTLTAWRHRLRLSEYDPDAVTAFLAEYLGRGPENAVR